MEPASATEPPLERVAEFERLRPRLFGIAYRMLGAIEDAEDVLQEAFLRWHRADAATVRAPEGWLVAVVTRLAIDRARRLAAERERYVGDWLPEPLASDPPAPDRSVELASDLSMAFLVLLERLGPEERAALLLRDVFDADYDEIARVLEKSQPACRQLVHRARTRVRGDRPRMAVSPATTERLLGRFLDALAADDQDALLAVVAPDATWTSDSGGKVPAARNVLHGAQRIARFALSLERKGRGRVTHRLTWLNGEPAFLSYVDGRLVFATAVECDGDRLTAFFRVLNPAKLSRVEEGGATPPPGSPAAAMPDPPSPRHSA